MKLNHWSQAVPSILNFLIMIQNKGSFQIISVFQYGFYDNKQCRPRWDDTFSLGVLCFLVCPIYVILDRNEWSKTFNGKERKGVRYLCDFKFACWVIFHFFFKNSFRNTIRVLKGIQIRTDAVLVLIWVLFAKIISRQQKLQLAKKKFSCSLW